MNRTELIAHLRDLYACDEALEWIEQTPGEPKDLWAACQRGDWMLWLLAAVGYDERTLRHIACDIAADVLPIYERAYPDDRRPRDCIAVARRHADGEATDDELIAARDAAWDAADAVARGAARDAARAAAEAAAWATPSDAAWPPSWSAADYAAYTAVSDAMWAATWTDEACPAAMSRFTDIIRARVSWADVERAIAEVGAQEACSK